jgi:hypothetical protein
VILLAQDNQDLLAGQIINVGNGEDCTTAELARLIAEVMIKANE